MGHEPYDKPIRNADDSAALVIISNRSIDRRRNREYSIFSGGANSCGIRIAQGWHYYRDGCKLDLVDRETHIEAVKTFVNSVKNQKPWIFFIHGNNQTYKKNLKKTKLIQKKYDANMVIFSWPSKTYTAKSRLVALMFGIGSLLDISKKKREKIARGLVEEKLKQYKTAQKIADDSVGHFIEAIALFNEHISPNLDGQKTMLVHSLGNRLLKGAAENNCYDIYVDKIIVHQADIESSSHHEWLWRFGCGSEHMVHVTRNKYDAALLMSDIANNAGAPLTRLGNHDDGITMDERLNYNDYTGLFKFGMEHELAWGRRTFRHLQQDMNDVFRF